MRFGRADEMQFENESMREWIFETLSGQQMHNF